MSDPGTGPHRGDKTERISVRISTPSLDALRRRLKVRQARTPEIVLSDLVREAIDAFCDRRP